MSEVKATVSENTNAGTAQPISARTMSAGVQALAEPGTNSGVEQRYQQADYIDVTGGSGTAQYELLGFGVTKLDNSPAAQTTSKRYVNQKSATQKIGSYQFSAPLEFDLVRSEAAIAYIADIGENEKTGAEAETNYVKVYLTKPVASKDNAFEAKRRKVAVEIADFADNDGEIQGTGNLLGVSDWEDGEFNTQTKTFTSSAEATV